MPNLIGQTVAHCEILENLESSGRGVINKAEESKLTRIVALKFPPPFFTIDLDPRELVSHEVQADSSSTSSPP